MEWTLENELGLVFVVRVDLMLSRPKYSCSVEREKEDLLSLPRPPLLTSFPLCCLLAQVAYHRLLHLSYIPTLLETLKTLFLSLYSPYLTSFVESVKGGVAPAAGEKAVEWDFKQAFEGWDGIFEKVLKKAEEGEAKVSSRLDPSFRFWGAR
jgi:hypothetical protein